MHCSPYLSGCFVLAYFLCCVHSCALYITFILPPPPPTHLHFDWLNPTWLSQMITYYFSEASTASTSVFLLYLCPQPPPREVCMRASPLQGKLLENKGHMVHLSVPHKLQTGFCCFVKRAEKKLIIYTQLSHVFSYCLQNNCNWVNNANFFTILNT